MHFATLIVPALAAFTHALPRPSNAIGARGVSDACAAQPDGYGPVPYKNDATHFLQFGTFSTVSTTAAAPGGYQRTFHNHLASTQGQIYMGLYTLTSYDSTSCSGLCNTTSGCQGFNVFFERDPSLNPAPNCTNPTAITNYKCTLWGQPPTVVNATNAGQMRSNFSVVIAGSNGYAKIGTVAANLVDDGTNPYT